MSPDRTVGVAGPVLPEVRMHLHAPPDPGVGVVVETRVCTASHKAAGFVRHLAIDVSRTRLAGNFRVGQSFGVIPPGVNAHGKPHKVRLYSIACPSSGEDGHGQVLSTTVKRTIDEHWETHRLFLGVASNWLCDLREGDEVPVTGPNGKRFLLPADPDAHDYIFFATGTGIAPFRGMLSELLTTGSASRIVLVMGVPYQTDLLYDDELAGTAAETDRFTYLTALSRQPQPDGNAPMYVQQRLHTHAELLGGMLENDRTLVYICGVVGMELGIFQALARVLRPRALGAYLQVDPEAAAGIGGWTRRMIHRQVRPTRRVFMEVY